MPATEAVPSARQTNPAVDWYKEYRTTSMPIALQYATAIGLTALATAIAAGFDRGVTIPNLSLIYVLPVIALAILFGLGPSIFGSVLGALSYSFFFTSPRFSLAVDDSANIWAIALLFVTGCAASAVASAGRRHAENAEALKIRQAKLHRFSEILIREREVAGVLEATADVLKSIYDVPVAVIVPSREGAEKLAVRDVDELTASEREAMSSALGTGQKVLGGIYPHDQSRFDFWPAQVRGGAHTAVIGLAFDSDERTDLVDDVVGPIACLLALWLEGRLANTP